MTTDDLRALVADSLLKTLGDEKRDELITAALKQLLEPQKGSYGGVLPSKLEETFSYAVADVGRKLITEKLATDEDFKTKVSAVISEAIEKFLTEKRDAVVENMSHALAQMFKVTDRY